MMAWVLAQAPDYDAFSDREGNIVTAQHGLGLIAMMRRPGQVDAVYADATKGNARAQRVFQTLETDYFPDYGRELADLVNRLPCLVPAFRELSGWCVLDWSFVDFLSKDQPGGARLRKALFDGFAERARERELENQLVMSAMNALLGVGAAAAVIREAGTSTTAAKVLSSEARRGIRSLEKRIAEHEAKLANFKANPTVRAGMEGQPKEVIQAAQQARIRHMEKEIQTFKENIEKLRRGE